METGFETSVVVLGLPNGTVATGSAGDKLAPEQYENPHTRGTGKLPAPGASFRSTRAPTQNFELVSVPDRLRIVF